MNRPAMGPAFTAGDAVSDSELITKRAVEVDTSASASWFTLSVASVSVDVGDSSGDDEEDDVAVGGSDGAVIAADASVPLELPGLVGLARGDGVWCAWPIAVPLTSDNVSVTIPRPSSDNNGSTTVSAFDRVVTMSCFSVDDAWPALS